MAKNYAEIAFTEEVKKLQEKYGSRSSYARMERLDYTDGLTENEIGFIQERDSLYMASVGENGFPYIQHRGGPKGFLRVLDKDTLGFIDFSGNFQFISVGNLKTQNKASLILMDYRSKTRLKIYVETEVKDISESPELLSKLELKNYKHTPERIMLLHVIAYNWNCPQHITPRYSLSEVEHMFHSRDVYINSLEEELRVLR